MSIKPEGEAVRTAVKWISEEKKADSQKEIKQLIQEACLKFDLTPKDAQFLIQFYQQENT